MPRILITGIPAATHPEALRRLLTLDLPMVVQNVDGFRISREHVYAHALPDLLERQVVAVMFAVDGLIAKPERTAKMRQALCGAVADAIASYLERTDTRYASIIGWCAQIHRDDDGFVRKTGPASGPQPN
jgi:hypothetical protein